MNLSFLNLSNNPLVNLPNNCFINTQNLKVIIFRNIKFEDIEDQPFTFLGVKIIVTDDYRVSCTSPRNVFCSISPPWYLSCSGILPGAPLKVACTAISVFIIFFNILSIVLLIHSFKKNKTFSIIVIAINFNDFICGLYLCNIWGNDIMFQGTYLIKEEDWKSHLFCIIAFYLILYFSFLRLFLLLLLSVSRLMAVLDPVNTKFKSFTVITHYLGCSFAFPIIVILIFIIFIQKDNVIPTSLCLPFVDPTGQFLLIKIMTWFVALLQTSASVAMVIMNFFLVKAVKESKEALGSLNNLNKTNTRLIVQIIVTSLSNIMCWIPASVFYLSVMFLTIYPIHLVTWTTIIFLSLNSIINPIIFLLRFSRK